METIEELISDMAWLNQSINETDLKISKAMYRSKRAIMDNNRTELLEPTNINAAGQEAIAADVVAEKTFLRTLEDEKLSGILYSEESGVKHFGKPDEGDENSVVLLLDPLDGSQNYLKGIPFGCISVAYGPYFSDARFGDLTKASIMNLYAEEVFFAEKGVSAWFNGNELIPKPISNSNKPIEERNIQISYYAYGAKASKYYFDFQETYTLRSLGSAAWELALLADHRNDAFADIRGVLKKHDFAAAKIIIEAIGGSINFLNFDDDAIAELPLDDFTSGYAVLSSLDQELLDHLFEDFRRHGLIK